MFKTDKTHNFRTISARTRTIFRSFFRESAKKRSGGWYSPAVIHPPWRWVLVNFQACKNTTFF